MTTDTTREGVHADQDADELRGALVDRTIVRHQQQGLVLQGEVEAALRTVPRHLFAPGVSLEKAYADGSIVTKRNERGSSISSVSAPWLQTMMLGQLQVAPGQRVLEIGSGGYNAALLRELVGPEGSVTTLDIDQEIADRARTCLATAGYRDVHVLCADGEFGAAEYGPFDRIIVTVGTRDIPPAWVEQLAEGGRLVVPLRTKGLNRSWALEHSDGYLTGRDPMTCGFVPMQGLGEYQGHSIPLHGDEVSLWLDAGQQVETVSLGEVLSTPRAQAWSGVTVRKGETFDDVDLWLARLPDFCILSATQDAVNRGLVSPDWHLITLALVDRGSSLAYLAKLRPVHADKIVRELGAYAHGPDAVEVADRFVEQIRIWDRDHRHGPGPRLTVHPANTPDAELPSGLVVDRRHTRIVISWPDHAE
ncbi:MAG: methyltransferase, FxLD system [Pseudonocardiaceae bacterium]